MIKRLMLMAAVTMLEIMPAITFAHETEPGSPEARRSHPAASSMPTTRFTRAS